MILKELMTCWSKLMPPLLPILSRLKVNSPLKKDSLRNNRPKNKQLKTDSQPRKLNVPNGKPLMIAPKRPGNFNATLFLY